MKVKARYPTWFDARSAASEKSLEFGFAWVIAPVPPDLYYHIEVGAATDSVPYEFIAEYKAGAAQ